MTEYTVPAPICDNEEHVAKSGSFKGPFSVWIYEGTSGTMVMMVYTSQCAQCASEETFSETHDRVIDYLSGKHELPMYRGYAVTPTIPGDTLMLDAILATEVRDDPQEAEFFMFTITDAVSDNDPRIPWPERPQGTTDVWVDPTRAPLPMDQPEDDWYNDSFDSDSDYGSLDNGVAVSRPSMSLLAPNSHPLKRIVDYALSDSDEEEEEEITPPKRFKEAETMTPTEEATFPTVAPVEDLPEALQDDRKEIPLDIFAMSGDVKIPGYLKKARIAPRAMTTNPSFPWNETTGLQFSTKKKSAPFESKLYTTQELTEGGLKPTSNGKGAICDHCTLRVGRFETFTRGTPPIVHHILHGDLSCAWLRDNIFGGSEDAHIQGFLFLADSHIPWRKMASLTARAATFKRSPRVDIQRTLSILANRGIYRDAAHYVCAGCGDRTPMGPIGSPPPRYHNSCRTMLENVAHCGVTLDRADSAPGGMAAVS
nr:putative Zn finger-like protein [Salmonid herpesvirus 1]